MWLGLDIFSQNPFKAIELTEAINVVPNAYGLMRELNLFPNRGVYTTQVAVFINNGVLNLLPTRPRGGPASLATHGRGEARILQIPHIPHEDLVLPNEVQDVLTRAIAIAANAGPNVNPSQLQLQAVEDLVNSRLDLMRQKHAITLEHLRVGGLKGQILDYDGSVILDLFTAFGVTQHVQNFALNDDTTDVRAMCWAVSRWMEDNLLGETMNGVLGIASPEFFDALVGHPDVEEAWRFVADRQGGGPDPTTGDVRRGFNFGGIYFREYRGVANQLGEDNSLTARRFIPAGDCRFIPLGTTDSAATYFAPADFLDTVNTQGIEVYAKQAVDPELQRFVKLHTQSNPLPIFKRPALLVRGTSQ